MTASSGQFAPIKQRNLQERFTSQATTKISIAGQIRWVGFYHIITRGTNSVEPGGHFRIDMPADGFAVPVAGGGTSPAGVNQWLSIGPLTLPHA